MIWLQLWLSPGAYSRVHHDQIVPIRQGICFATCSLDAYGACVVVDCYSLSTKDLFPCPIGRHSWAAIPLHASIARQTTATLISRVFIKNAGHRIDLTIRASAEPTVCRQHSGIFAVRDQNVIPVLGGILFAAGGFCSVWSWPGYMNGF